MRTNPNCAHCHGEGGGLVAVGPVEHWEDCDVCHPSVNELERRRNATDRSRGMFMHPDGSMGWAESSAAAMHAPLA